LGIGLENEIDEIAGVERACHVAEVAALHALDGLDFGALLFKFALETLDGLLDGVFVAFLVEDEESFVSVFHGVVFLLFN
jgi:hypothetical protein